MIEKVDVQVIFNTVMAFNKLDLVIIIMLAIQMIMGFIQGYKKSIYHSIKYVAAYILTRLVYNLIMPAFAGTAMYRGYQEWINDLIVDSMPTNFSMIIIYPVDKYVFNMILFVSMLIFIRLVIMGWHPEVILLDRVLGVVVGIAKVIVITTILVLLITPFIEMIEPIAGGNIIEESKIVSFMKSFNPFLNGARIEF